MKLDKKDYKLLYSLFSMRNTTLLKSLHKICKKYYAEDKIHATKEYIYIEGEIPIALVAHVDTVHRMPVSELYHDEKKNVLWSPQGLGADDRAGVFAIIKMLLDGYRPTIIFCDGEEIGGVGANALIRDFPQAKEELKYMIELDRRGARDAVFYSCDNDKFEEYITSFGFVTDWGTFSDISIIAPAWGFAAVNLSIGYENEHSLGEYLNYQNMFETIDRVEKMFDEVDMSDKYEYIHEVCTYDYNSYGEWIGKYMRQNKDMCNGCGKMFNFTSLMQFTYENSTFCFCQDCKKDWIVQCTMCGQDYLHMRTDEHEICDSCMKEIFG